MPALVTPTYTDQKKKKKRQDFLAIRKKVPSNEPRFLQAKHSNRQQDRQCTTIAKRRRVLATLLQWKISKYYIFWECVYSLRYPEFNAHAPYCRLWPLRRYYIFPHYLINGANVEIKRLFVIKSLCWSSLQLLSWTFLILRRNEPDMIKNIYWSSCKVPVFVSDLNKTWIFFGIFSKNSHISNYIRICSVGADLFHADRRMDGQTDRQDEVILIRSNEMQQYAGVYLLQMSEIWSKIYIGLHVKCPFLYQIWIKLEFSRYIFEKFSYIKLH